MAFYSLRVKRSAEKELRAIPKADILRIIRKIQSLGENPRPSGSEKLSGEDRRRIRQGDWRVVYVIDDEKRIVEITKIGHRREVYR